MIIKRVFCPCCGANIIDERNPWFWFKYSPWYVWHLFWCARPHGLSWFLIYYDANQNNLQLKKEEKP